MPGDDKVIFLAYRNDAPTVASEEVLACIACQNKTWKVVYDARAKFPALRCACCGAEVGRLGWVGHDHDS